MSSKLDPAIWPRNTGQRIPCFDRYQLTITRMSNFKEERYKPRHMSLSTCCLENGHHFARLRRCHRRAYAPISTTVSNDNHKKINQPFSRSGHMVRN